MCIRDSDGPLHGHWLPLDLQRDLIDSTLWKGALNLNGTASDKMRFMVSAVTGHGAVTVDTKLGAYHKPDEFDSGNTANLPPTTVQLAADNPMTNKYASTVTFSATLTGPTGLLANKRI